MGPDAKACQHSGCKFKSFCDQSMKVHMGMWHKQTKFPDFPKCKNGHLLQEHKSLEHPKATQEKRMQICPRENCCFQTLCKTSLQSHMKEHSLERPFKCEKCDYATIRPWQLLQHRWTHLGWKELGNLFTDCPNPNKNQTLLEPFKGKYESRERSTKAKKRKVEKLKSCPRMILETGPVKHYRQKNRRKSHIQSHKKDAHSPEIPSKCESLGKILKACPKKNCRFRTVRPRDIRQHLQLHSSKESFKCDKCDYLARLPSILERHLVNHLSSRDKDKFLRKCPVQNCDYQTINMGNLSRHGRTHSIKRFKYKNCDYAAKHQRLLEKHEMTHLKTIVKEKFHPLKNSNSKPQQNSKLLQKCVIRNRFYSCKVCSYQNDKNDLLALHNEEKHSLPYVVLTMLPAVNM